MTTVVVVIAVVAFLAGGLTLGSVIGVAMLVIAGGKIRSRAYTVCRAQVLREFGIKPAQAEGYNPDFLPRQRRRSPDLQTFHLVTRFGTPTAPRVLDNQKP